jgi:hypothetical protein
MVVVLTRKTQLYWTEDACENRRGHILDWKGRRIEKILGMMERVIDGSRGGM